MNKLILHDGVSEEDLRKQKIPVIDTSRHWYIIPKDYDAFDCLRFGSVTEKEFEREMRWFGLRFPRFAEWRFSLLEAADKDPKDTRFYDYMRAWHREIVMRQVRHADLHWTLEQILTGVIEESPKIHEIRPQDIGAYLMRYTLEGMNILNKRSGGMETLGEYVRVPEGWELAES